MVTRMQSQGRRGFTLIELLVVLSIVSLLLSVAVPRYFQSLDTARETMLAENLRQTRKMLATFYGDTGRYPETLDELVEKNYIKSLPLDPVTGSVTTWLVVNPKEGVRGRVYDIRSGAPGLDRLGRPFGEL